MALAIGLILATCAMYFFYTPFDEWSYLRFLLPAIALMVLLASVVTVYLLTLMLSRVRGASASVVVLITASLAIFCVRTAGDRLAFKLKFLEQRYRSAGLIVRDRLPPNAVVLSVWDSGAVRFHGRKEALSWAGLDPAWLDPASPGSAIAAARRTSSSSRGKTGVPQSIRKRQRHRQTRLAAEIRDR